MTRPRGNKTSKAEREARRSKALEVLKENPNASQQQVAEAVGVSRMTLYRDLKSLTLRLATANLAEHQQRVEIQEAVLELMEQALLEEKIEPEVANSWRQIRADIADLRGLNAPAKSLSVKVDASADPAQMGRWQRALHELRNVPDEKLDDFWTGSRGLIAELAVATVTVRDASWFPEPEPKLLEAKPDEAD
ncbi:MAG TPA: HTH domain-containing protein [Terriglobales bacterium]|jgi:AcrR family transcriptional regulator